MDELLPLACPNNATILHNLASALAIRFETQGDGRDLDEAIQDHRIVLQLRPEGHPDRSLSLNNLGNALALFMRFEQRGDQKDLDEAIQHHQIALQLVPESHPLHLSSRNNLASALWLRFGQRGDGKDLDEAIQHHRITLQLRPEGHPDRPLSLNNLANALSTRFEQRGDGKDLDEAIQPEGHPRRSSSLNNLATGLWTRFGQRGDVKDLDDAIRYHQIALQLTPEGHPDHSSSLDSLANGLWTRFEHRGDGKDLDDAIQYYQTALRLQPECHPGRSLSLDGLANALSTRFRERGDGTDLDEAIQHHRNALQLRPEGHPGHLLSFNNLASALLTRFEQQGDEKDLDEAIQYPHIALQLMPEGHPLRLTSLNNLASALSTRFKQQGDGKDLDGAIQHHQIALQLVSEGQPLHSFLLNNLANGLHTRFEHRGDGKDLDDAIQYHRTALQLTHEGHPLHSTSLNNLANGLWARFELRGDGKDLDEAIQLPRAALQLTPKGHTHHTKSLNTLAIALLTRFEQQGDGKDLDEAIQPEGHPLHDGKDLEEAIQYNRICSYALNNLTNTLLRQFQWQGGHGNAAVEQSLTPLSHLRTQVHLARDLQDSMHHYKVAATQYTSEWASIAEEHQHPSALDAYAQSLHLLDSHISMTTTIQSRHQVRMQFPHHLSVDAASCALRQGNICYAVELLEQGRALHWTQLARFRTSLDDIQSCDGSIAKLANQFQELSAMLNRPGDVSFDEDCSIAVIEAKARHYRDLFEEWNKVVGEIRTLKGFSQFLLPPLFKDLQGAASSRFSCDAIIVLHTQSPIHIKLQITWDEMCDLVAKHFQNIHHSDGPDHHVFVEIMHRIWKIVTFPIVQKLKRFVQKHSRIWWCPTSLFTALPLHTAGEYQHGVKAHKDSDTLSPLQHKGFYIPQPVMFTKLKGSLSTRQQALQMLQDHQWFHLACHGKQVFQEPFKSYFAMHDGQLSLLDIINANISGHEFAFLSACETAMGDLSAPDEVVHLAAGLQFMGVKSVIGTLWKVGDEVAYKLVSAYYKEFCKNGTMDCTMAAGALHQAVALLAKDNVPLVERAMFVHIGI
ncbi:TPR-like protein [Melanogaster broomeanus]|nr:TPR-like protein [Melanogaster broomeanus]